MTITGIRTVRIPFYATRAQIAQDFKISMGTVDSRIKDILSEKERYGDFAVIDGDGSVRVNQLAFIDYMKYKKRLDDRNLRKGVPPYDPVQIAKEIGLYEESVI